jgi:hypothetical protein
MTGQQNSVQFLTQAESEAVDLAMLSMHEKFLTRITISSMRLLKHIAEDLGVAIEDLTTSQVINWFEQDAKIKREQGIEAAFLKW